MDISTKDGDTIANGVPDVISIAGKTTLHVSYWTANGTSLQLHPYRRKAPGIILIASGTLTQGAWTDLELPITNSGFDPTTLRQLKFVYHRG